MGVRRWRTVYAHLDKRTYKKGREVTKREMEWLRIEREASSPGTLKYATGAAGGTWASETLDARGRVGRYPSLAVDGAGRVHISYYDETSSDLRYISRGPGESWSSELLDATGGVGMFTSIGLDRMGRVHIGYYDVGNQNLMYITRACL